MRLAARGTADHSKSFGNYVFISVRGRSELRIVNSCDSQRIIIKRLIGGVRVEVIVKYNGDIFAVAQSVGGQAERLSEGYAVLTLPEEALDELYLFTEIEDIEMPKKLWLGAAKQLGSSCISTVQRMTGQGLSGEGVIVAVTDSGIDYTHPAFRYADGRTRILSIWDQTIDGSPPEGFNEGSEYSREEIDYALTRDDPFSVVPSRDISGHGTAVAGIAAGSSQNNGVAYGSELIIVKVGRRGNDVFAESTDIMRALRYTVDKARDYGRPAAINLSFGMNNGSHDGTSLFEEFIASIANEWKVVIVTPTGNEGAAGHHYGSRVAQGHDKYIRFFTAAGIESFYLTMWKNFADSFNIELIYPDGSSSGIIRPEDHRRTVSSRGMLTNIIYGQPTRYSVDQEIFIKVQTREDYLQAGAWTLILHPVSIFDGRVSAWLPNSAEAGKGTYFSDPSVYNTMTIPSTALKVIRVSGYNDSIGSIAPFSGVGSKDDPDAVPDVAAPAVNILAPKAGGGYDSFTGTSFAAPFVTGSAALLMEWGIVRGNAPFLYGERIRAFLRLGARRAQGGDHPDPYFGYGRLCLEDTLEQLEKYTFI